jgi:hypothetical protein
MNDNGMKQAEKLIGGWVAGTLTESERSVLLRASLENQALFDAMADEEGMREVLADPAVRRELAAMLQPRRTDGFWQRLFKPGPMAAFGTAVLAMMAFFVMRRPALEERALAPASAVLKNEAPAAPVITSQSAKPEPVRAARRKSRPLPPAPAPAQAEPEKRDVAAGARREAPPLALPPAAPVVAPPAAAAPPAVAEGQVAKPKEALMVSTGASSVAPPVRYRVERLQPLAGQWVEFGGEMSQGAQARLVIETTQPGVLTVRSGSESFTAAVKPGQEVIFPAAGSLPSGSGEREVAILFQPGALPALAAPMQSYRARAAAGMRQQPGQQQQRAAAADAAPAEYSVTVRLRYR